MDTGTWQLTANNTPQKFTFQTDGRCQLSNVHFDTQDPPPHFSNRSEDPHDHSVSYTYDGQPISGYTFKYKNNYALDGSGSGIVKN